MSERFRQLREWRSTLRPRLRTLVFIAILLDVVLLTPEVLEQDLSSVATKYLDPKEIAEQVVPDEPTLAPGITKGKIPDYSIENFHFISSKGGSKEWKIVSRTAHRYLKEDIVHGRDVVSFIYDSEGKATRIDGLEAKYQQKLGELEVFGKVEITFPDGFKVYSDYMKYFSQTRQVHVPPTHYVWGKGSMTNGDIFSFNSFGLNYNMIQNSIVLEQRINMTLTKPLQKGQKEPEKTTIDADHCVIDRTAKIAHFTMDAIRKPEDQFVIITQPTLFVRSRKTDLYYGGQKGFLKHLIAYDDVFINETDEDEKVLRYATCGEAEFDSDRDQIVLTKYPQVYQNTDTVTGEVIIIYRNSDIVEVQQSNAYSDSQKGL